MTSQRPPPAPDDRVRPAPVRYAVAALSVGAAVGARSALDPVWGIHKPFVLFFPAVMIAAWFGGLGPGVFASLLSAAAVLHWWTRSAAGAPISSADAIGLAVFVASGCFIAALAHSLEKARRTEASLRRVQEEMLSIVAHDVRSPLGTIAMSIDLLSRRGEVDGSDGQQRLASMKRAVSRIDALVGNLLDASRVAEGQFSIERRREDLGAIVRESVDAVRPLAETKRVTVRASCPVPVPVVCDRERLLQALGNLLGNAIRHTPARGVIEVAATLADGNAHCVVADTGPGIAPDARGHLFERFWRGRDGGTGLGLYIVKGIVEAHGGRIWVESIPGAGAHFHFVLPSAPSPATRPLPSPTELE